MHIPEACMHFRESCSICVLPVGDNTLSVGAEGQASSVQAEDISICPVCQIPGFGICLQKETKQKSRNFVLDDYK